MKKFAIIILVMLSYLAACEKQTQKPNNTSGCFDIPDGTPLIKTTYYRLHYAAYEYDNFNRIIKETIKYPMQDTIVLHYFYYDDSLVIKSDYSYYSINYLSNSSKTFPYLNIDQNCFLTKYTDYSGASDEGFTSIRVNNNGVNYTSHEYYALNYGGVNKIVDSFYYDLTKTNTIGFRNFGITFSGQSSDNLLTKTVTKVKFGNTNIFEYDTVFYDYEFDLDGRIIQATSHITVYDGVSSKPHIITPYILTDTLMKFFTYYDNP